MMEEEVELAEFISNTNSRGPRALVLEYRAICARDATPPTPSFNSNPTLNRWKDIRCFEENRVVLEPKNGYIHANFVDGHNHPKKYICTQAPLPHTEGDFWKMVWQEKVAVIVSLTRVGGNKCTLYFPVKQGKARATGHIKISVCVEGCYNKSLMQLGNTTEGEKRTLLHFLFHQWPDKGNPDSRQFLDFMRDVRTEYANTTADAVRAGLWTENTKGPPMLVHCSAGVGRTGTLVAMDIIQDQLSDPSRAGGPTISIPATVLKLRRQRHCAVQKPEQYIFLYLGVVEYSLRQGLLNPDSVDVTAYLTTINSSMPTPSPSA